MNQPSLIADIKHSAVDSSVPITDLLRKCRLLAARLRFDEFSAWVDRELEGYSLKEELPPYRVFGVQSFGHFLGRGGAQLGNAPIPPSSLPDEYQSHASECHMREGIGSYASLVEGTERENLKSNWNADLISILGSRIYVGYRCMNAWRVIPYNALVGILEQIRNRVLKFVMAIEEENPAAGEAVLGTSPIPAQTVSNVFHTSIYGGTNNVASGSTHLKQQMQVSFQPGEFGVLRSSLESAGAEPAEIERLEIGLSQAVSTIEKENVADTWLGRTTRAAIAATRAFTVEIAAKAIAEFLRPPAF